MKNVLLAGTALLGVAFIASPASAELNLDLGGYFRGYAVYADQDTANTNDFEFRRDTEIHVSGETTLDNGLTVGFHTEQLLGSSGSNGAANLNGGTGTTVGNRGATTTDEAYAYFSGQWGRVNFGQEDGAAYLLQIAAPSADSNVDGLRAYINGVNGGEFGYAQDDVRFEDKITYLSPKFNGFQAGVSYIPSLNDTVPGTTGFASTTTDASAYEVAGRWDGEFNGFGISAGAGYTKGSDDGFSAAAIGAGAGDLEAWNAGLNVAFNAFSVGAVFTNNNNFDLGDTDTWVFGAAWDNGPYHVGASYLTQDNDGSLAAIGIANDAERATIGAGYTFGPGMTFRGAVAFGETAAATNNDFTQVTLGTDIQF